ncbi:hypothetical protein [Streptomyces sp. NPDC048172]|uniref:hypothetical protein n=1 Tax=Streptomyces sp. NPDC048172 TaxID=3365505 RepID=UPI00371FD960
MRALSFATPTTRLLLTPRRRHMGVPHHGDRPAWQSPYGPPPPRAHRGRWPSGPVLARSRRPAFAFSLKG